MLVAGLLMAPSCIPNRGKSTLIVRVPWLVVLSVASVAFRASATAGRNLAQTLDEANRSTHEIPFGAKLIFEEAFEAEVQRFFLVGEQQENRRRYLGLGDVVDPDRPRLWIRSAIQVDVLFQPAIQLAGRNFALARGGHFVDQRKKFLRAFAGFGGKKHDRGVA